MEKKMAITAIQNKLMEIESFAGSSPPAYSSMHNSPQMASSNFPPPPQYPQQRRMPPQVPLNAQGGPTRLPMGQTTLPISRIQYDRAKVALAEKERLLQQQKVQQIVVPVNATTSGKARSPLAHFHQSITNFIVIIIAYLRASFFSSFPASVSGAENINALINNSIAPNVALTRSTNSNSLSDSQLRPGPGFSPSLMQQQLSPGQRNQPFSPQGRKDLFVTTLFHYTFYFRFPSPV